MNKQSKIGKLIYYGAISVLVLMFGVFILEKSQVTNLYNKPVNESLATSPRPVNDIQYTPADPTDNDTTNQQKQDGTIGTDSQPPSAANSINVILSAAVQDTPGGPVVIRVLLNNTTNGTCDVTMLKDDVTKTYSASVKNAGTYYTCDGFDIPFEDLQSGAWQTTVTVTNTDRTGSTKQIVEVK